MRLSERNATLMQMQPLVKSIAGKFFAKHRHYLRWIEYEDCVQQANFVLLRRLSRGDWQPERASVVTFLYPRIWGAMFELLRRESYAAQRDTRSERVPLNERMAFVDSTRGYEASILLPELQNLADSTPVDRMILQKMLAGYSQHEVARQIGCRQSTIAKRLKRLTDKMLSLAGRKHVHV
jgi:RNA polymerase sigma factor (sigma-70 family)